MDTLRQAFVDYRPTGREASVATRRTVRIVQEQGKAPAIASLFREQLAEVVGAKPSRKTTAATRTEAERTRVQAVARRSIEEAGR